MSTNYSKTVIYESFLVPQFCAFDICFNQLTRHQRMRGRIYCSNSCSAKATHAEQIKKATARSADKRRGSNPNRHIMIRVNGVRVYQHRYIVEQQIGCKLADDEIIHHIDGDKHHNCFWKNACAVCQERGYPNLEVIVGQDAHILRHQKELQQQKRRKRR